MKRLRMFMAMVLGLTLAANAGDLAIQSFDGTGQLTFNELTTAQTYRVEWANTLTGAWNIGSPGVTGIVARGFGQGVATVGVAGASCFYRVVATVTNAAASTSGDYLVVDVSGGPSASSYPVSYLAAVPVGGWTDAHKTTNIVFRRIPATVGAFTMGSPSGELGRYSDETQHQVTLSQDFYIGVFEVTQKQWERVMGDWPSYFYHASYRDTRPVEQVSYYQIRENADNSAIDPNWPATNVVGATSFMGKLRAKTGKAFDLPTESQWEYACRAGTTTALNSGYDLTSTSSDARMAEVGRYWYNGPETYGYDSSVDTNGATAKAGSYLPNTWGLYDMHGNVWEWCLDWYGDYPDTVSDPKGPTSGQYGSYRAVRGGSWGFDAIGCRSAYRNDYYPDYRGNRIGFRAVLPPGQ